MLPQRWVHQVAPELLLSISVVTQGVAAGLWWVQGAAWQAAACAAWAGLTQPDGEAVPWLSAGKDSAQDAHTCVWLLLCVHVRALMCSCMCMYRHLDSNARA
jgi:hypothetical protein